MNTTNEAMSNATPKPNPYYILGILQKNREYDEFEQRKGERYLLYRKQWRKRLEDKRHGNAPLNLNAELTTKCNMACTFCYNSALDESEIGTLDLRSFDSLLDDLVCDPEFSSVNLNGLGESLLVANFPDYVASAKNHNVIDIMFHTNASIMSSSIAKSLLDAGVDKVIFSVDSPIKETYESMRLQKTDRKGFPFERIKENVLKFKEARDNHPNKAVIRATMVLTDHTKDEKQAFIEKWQKVADILTVQDLTWRDNTAYNWRNGERSPDEIDLELLKEQLIDSKVKWSCPYLYQSLFVHQDGTYAPCSNPYARKELIMGHASSETPREVWNNKAYQELRNLHTAGEWYKHPTCSRCEIAIIEAYKTSMQDSQSSFANVPSEDH